MSIKVYGASDDLIEVAGDIRTEFSPTWEGTSALAFSDGTILEVKYSDEGIWRVTLLVRGTATFSVEQATSADDDMYSDIATLEGDISWVLCAGEDWELKRR